MIDLIAELKTAMKEKNKPVKMAIADLKGRIKNYKIDKGIDDISDAEFVSLVKSSIKSSKNSIELFTTDGNQEVVDLETSKLVYLEKFLPQAMTEDELSIIVNNAISVHGDSKANMGSVMKAVREDISVSSKDADMSAVSKMVKSKLV
jgi:uncharacterized protein YqeY